MTSRFAHIFESGCQVNKKSLWKNSNVISLSEDVNRVFSQNIIHKTVTQQNSWSKWRFSTVCWETAWGWWQIVAIFWVLLIPHINKGHGRTFQLLTWHTVISRNMGLHCHVNLCETRHKTGTPNILTKSLQVLYSSAEASMLWKAIWLYLLVNCNKNDITFSVTVLWPLREDHREHVRKKMREYICDETTFPVLHRLWEVLRVVPRTLRGHPAVRGGKKLTTTFAQSATQILSTTDPTVAGCAWSRRWDGPRASGKPSRPSGAPPERTSKSTVNHK